VVGLIGLHCQRAFREFAAIGDLRTGLWRPCSPPEKYVFKNLGERL